MTDSTEQWDRSLSWSDGRDDVPETRKQWVRWQHQRGGASLMHSVCLQVDVTGASDLDLRVMQLRWYCDLVLASLPDQGLEEALESLVRIYSFHTLPAPTFLPQRQEAAKLLKAKMNRPVERPAFTLPEE